MKKGLIFALCIFFHIPFVISQWEQDTIYFDSKWDQCTEENFTYYRLVDIDTIHIQFIVKDYFKSGQIQMEGSYRSINPDVQNGEFIYWYENGTKNIKCHYILGKLDGLYQKWYPNGVLNTEMEYKNNLPEGTEKKWDETGTLLKTTEYKSGLLDGYFITYYNNGEPLRKDYYKNNKLVKGKCYTRSGNDTTYFEYFIMPRFSEGIKDLKAYINEKLNYPDSARVRSEEGLVEVKFTVDKIGKISDIKITKEDKDYFNEEAIRVVNELPEWIPGKRDGKEIDVTITIPIYFRLK